MNSHTEEAVQSGIIRSVRNVVRGLIGFIGFQAELTDILDLVEERFGKAPTVDKLQKELYLLGQERRKRKKSSSSPVIWNLQTRFPGHYDRKQLKDQLFFGMHQHLHNSTHFLYKNKKRQHMKICCLPPEREKWTEQKVRSLLRVKGMSVEHREEGTTELRSKILTDCHLEAVQFLNQ